jgi:hypothetical protein
MSSEASVAKLLIVTSLMFSLASCENLIHKCGECFTPPPSFVFEIIDSAGGENLYSSEYLNSDKIEVRDENNTIVSHSFIDENGLNVIAISEIGWNNGLHRYTLSLSENLYIKFELEMAKITDDCCTFYQTKNLKIEDYSYEQSALNGIIKIKINALKK